MTDTLLAMLPAWGPWLLAATAFLACLMVPVPASLLAITGGALVAAGDLDGVQVAVATWAGAVLGDQVIYFIGRKAGHFFPPFKGKRRRMLARARARLRRNGILTVFFSRWLFAPLAPSINLAAGALRFSHLRFTLASVTGDVFWVGLYVGLGYVFSANLSAATELASSTLGLLAALAALLIFGWWLRGAARRRSN
ncbi:DedA family protein [Phaeovulum sp.]|uniref:DedA family protein n=1 Tax=Phaeovulum sp. TaxID=2934796 RepID=UPI003562FB2C